MHKVRSDDEPLAFKKMHEFSPTDGFVEITESLADMIKFIANEPSMGLFYIQQHTQNAGHNLTDRKDDIEEKSREVTLHAEDSEDSITMIRSMKDCGTEIANEMIKDLRHSLAVMSKKQPKKGLLQQPNSPFRIGRTSSWSAASWGHSTSPGLDGNMATGYHSNVFRSAKEKANSFKWAAQLDSKESSVAYTEDALSAVEAGSSFSVSESNDEELPISSHNELQVMQMNKSMLHDQVLSSSENYEGVMADKEAQLEEWLGGIGQS